jgi:hypothetical protein
MGYPHGQGSIPGVLFLQRASSRLRKALALKSERRPRTLSPRGRGIRRPAEGEGPLVPDLRTRGRAAPQTLALATSLSRKARAGACRSSTRTAWPLLVRAKRHAR